MKKRGEKGFTLIELLVIVAIIGILGSISIAHFAGYRKRAFNTAAKSDLRTAVTAQEAYYVDHATYTANLANLTSTSYGVGLSEGVVLPITSANSFGYTMQAYHPSGNVTYTLSGPGGTILP